MYILKIIIFQAAIFTPQKIKVHTILDMVGLKSYKSFETKIVQKSSRGAIDCKIQSLFNKEQLLLGPTNYSGLLSG